ASRGSLIAHAASGYAIIALTPWKSVIASRAIQRRRPGWWASLLLTILVLVSVLSGILHSTGLLISAGAITAMEVHVGAALVAVPFAVWHIIARRIPDAGHRPLATKHAARRRPDSRSRADLCDRRSGCTRVPPAGVGTPLHRLVRIRLARTESASCDAVDVRFGAGDRPQELAADSPLRNGHA